MPATPAPIKKPRHVVIAHTHMQKQIDKIEAKREALDIAHDIRVSALDTQIDALKSAIAALEGKE